MTNTLTHIAKKLNKQVAIFPLATFRVLFGALMLFSTIRFWYYGWIEDFYITPSYFFSYFGQEWIQPYSATFIYGLFIIMGVSAFMILLGMFYRMASLLFFLSFTYVELIDKTTYLNHYYFVSLIAFLLIFIPAHRAFSIDSKLFPSIRSFNVPRWSILALQCQITILYFFAGVAKLNYDWLFEAQPMGLWLQSKTDLPLIGSLFEYDLTAFVFSWTGALFDLSIAFLLFSKKLRPVGYAAVVTFHLLTWWLFPIGIFPWVMIGCTLIFFSIEWHERIWSFISRKRQISDIAMPEIVPTRWVSSSILGLLAIHFIIQLTVPMRHVLHENDLYWTEHGYRFSWRVMLMEKTGHLEFRVRDIATQKESIVDPSNYFTSFQQRQLVTQPDMILQAAHLIHTDFQRKGRDVEIYANSFSSLNGKKHRQFVNPEVNLCSLKNDRNRDWILTYEK